VAVKDKIATRRDDPPPKLSDRRRKSAFGRLISTFGGIFRWSAAAFMSISFIIYLAAEEVPP
jgi:hypothetical protein